MGSRTKQGVERVPIKVRTSDGLDLTFWLWDRRRAKDRLLIVSPGFLQHHGTNIMRHGAQLFWDRYDVLGVDFRALAGNPGAYSFGLDESRELRAAFAWARRKRYRHVELLGFSMGAYIALKAVAEDPGPVKRLYFVSGPTRIEEVVTSGGPFLHFWSFLKNWRYIKLRVWAGSQFLFRWAWPLRWGRHPDARTLAAKVRIPVHYLVGTEDRLVLPRLTRAVYEATPSKKSWTALKGGQHAEYMALMQTEKFLAWMKRYR